jgi:hypothetical protein
VHRSNLAIASLGVLVGIAILILSVINQKEMQLDNSQLAQINKALKVKGVGPPPEDSPVLVRGGSVLIRGTWNCPDKTNYCTTTLNEPADLINLDGVDPIPTPGDNGDNDNSPELVSAGPTDSTLNWVITMTFREPNKTSEDSGTALKLCTTNSACTYSKGNAGNTVYLVGDSNGSFSIVQRDRAGVRYDLTARCGIDPLPGHESPCNHVHTLTIASAGALNGTRYHCVDGECTIAIGQP